MQIAVNHLHEGRVLPHDLLHPNGFVLLLRECELSRRLFDQLLEVEMQTSAELKEHVHRVNPACFRYHRRR
jgi:hypothetical protein